MADNKLDLRIKISLTLVITIFLLNSCAIYRIFKGKKSPEEIEKERIEAGAVITGPEKKIRPWNKLSKAEKKRANKARKIYNEAVEDFKKGKINSAEKKFLDSLKIWSELYEANLGLANVYLKKKNYNNVIKYAEKYLEYETRKPDPYYLKAEAFKKLENIDKALQNYLIVIKLSPNDKEALFNIATLYGKKKLYTEAINYYKKILEKDKKYVPAYLGLGNLYLKVKNYEKAKEWFEKGYKQTNSSELKKGIETAEGYIKFIKAQKFYKQRKYKESLVLLESTEKLLKNNFGVIYLKAKVYKSLKQYSRAIEYLKKAKELNPENKNVYLLLGEAYNKIKKYEEATKILTEATARWNNFEKAYNLLGKIYLENTSSYESAIKNFKIALKLNPDNPVYYENLAKAYYMNGEYNKSIEICKKLIKKKPQLKTRILKTLRKAEAQILLKEADALFDKEKYDEAIKKYRMILTKYKDIEPSILKVIKVSLANAYIQIKKYKEAESLVKSVLAKEKNYIPALSSLERIYRETGRGDEAAKIVKKLENLRGKDATLYYKEGLNYEIKGKYKNALKLYKKALEIAPDYTAVKKRVAYLLYQKGVENFNKNNIEEALKNFQEALKYYPDFLEAKKKIKLINALSYIIKARNNPEKADEYFKKAFNIFPEYLEGYYSAISFYLKRKKFKKALFFAEQGIKYFPLSAELYILAGDVCKKMKNFKKAYSFYQKALQIKPDSIEAHNALGDLFLMQNDFENAITEYKAAVKIDPKNPETHINLGIVYYKKDDYKNALKEFEIAGKLAPDDAAVYINRGLTYHKLNKYKEAENSFLKALKLRGETPSIYFYLARTRYYMSGRTDDAIKAIEKALEMIEKPIYYYGAGKIYEKKMETGMITDRPHYLTKAIEAYRKVIKMAPGTRVAHWAELRLRELLKEVEIIGVYPLTSGSESTPLLINNVLISGDSGGTINFIDLSGKLKLKRNYHGGFGKITTDLVNYNNSIIFGTSDGIVYSVKLVFQTNSFSISTNWVYKAEGSITARPYIKDKRIFFVTSNGIIYGIDAIKGGLVWKYVVGGEVKRCFILHNGTIFAGNSDGTLAAVDTEGNLKWEITLTGGLKTEPGIFPNTTQMWVGTEEGFVYKINPENGKIISIVNVIQPVTSSIVVDNNRAYLGASNIFICIKDNDILWSYIADSEIAGTPVMYKGGIMFTTSEGGIYSVEKEMGKEKWSIHWNDGIKSKPLLVAQDKAFMSTTDGVLIELYFRK